MNLVAITGNIATDIELRAAGQSVVTSINLAVKDDFKRDTTHFIKVEAWGKTGIQGSLKVDKFQDKEGNNREITKVNASRVEFLDSKGDKPSGGTNTQGNQNQRPQPTQKAVEDNPFANEDGPVDISSSDLPF